MARRLPTGIESAEKNLPKQSEKRGLAGSKWTKDGAAGTVDDAELAASGEAKKIALAVVAAGLDKKATAIEIIDVTGKVDYTYLLVLMSGRSDRHVGAIAKGVQEDLNQKLKARPLSVEGMSAASWVLLDFNDVVVHVFQQEARLYYDLEGLWLDANRLSVPPPRKRTGDES